MKLLTPSNVKDVKSQDLTRELLRSQEMKKQADKIRKEMANAEADFKQMLSGQQERWANEEQEHSKRVSEMTNEIRVLENQKSKALEPVKLIEERATQTLKEANELKERLQEKESYNEDLTERLEERLDEVGQRETAVLQEELRLKKEKEGSENQKESIKSMSEALSSQMKEFAFYKGSEIKKIEELNKALQLKSLSLMSQEDKLKAKEDNLNVFKIKLDDRQKTLERGFLRLKNAISTYKKGSR